MKAMPLRAVTTFILLIACLPTTGVAADEVDDLLGIIAKVKLSGEGSTAARKASDQLAERGPKLLPRILVAMDKANVVAVNWYRTAYERIVAREFAKKSPKFPIESLQAYARDEKHFGRARRLTLELLDRLTPEFGRKLLPQLLNDPEFRGDAVDLALQAGDQAKANQHTRIARTAYRKAFRHARDSARVIRAARALRSIGEEVSVIEHMGFLTDWRLLGPFDAPGFSGLDKAFGPERNVAQPIDVRASYAGKGGKKIIWRRHRTDHILGEINLIQAIGPVKEAVGYAYTEVISPRDQTVELRCGADDNCTVWLNGKKILARRQWLNGTRLDRFTAPANMRKGKNVVLVKICQGPQHKNPAVPNNWSLQLRFCNAEGAEVGLVSALPKASPPPRGSK